MGFFFDNAQDKARKASLDAHAAENALAQATLILSRLEAQFNHLRKDIPAQAPAHALAPLARTLHGVRRHSEQLLTHLHHLESHVQRLERHVRNQQNHGR